MTRVLIWDLPTRLFHWALAASFLAAFAIGSLVDDDSAMFAIHMLLGGVAAFLVVLRLVWGLVGSRWSRFSEFVVSPAEVVAYLRGTLTGDTTRHTGHNPATSVAAYVIFALIIGLAVTGVLMGRAEVFEEIHEVLAWVTIAVVVAHIAGVVWHTIRCRENIALTMVDGRKEAEASEAIPSARPVVALVFVALVGLWTAGLIAGYDRSGGTVTIPVVGTTFAVGEGAEHGANEAGQRGEEDDD